MRFYNREKELGKLSAIEKQVQQQGSQMTVIVGRRRIGKTTLIRQAYPGCVYLFVSKKNEVLLCEEFVEVIQRQLAIKVHGSFLKFKDLFEYLLELAKTRSFNLVIDEFQEFLAVNPHVYAEMQNSWDAYKDNTKLNLVLSGSIYSLMKRIFEDRKEPLFGRANHRIHLKSFNVQTLQKIMHENAKNYEADDLLAFYMFTGGVAKYVELFIDNKALQLDTMLDAGQTH